MNDSTRQVGGALGVAVVGSLLTSGYVHRMASFVQTLPASARAAGDSIGAAGAAARGIGGADATTLLATARHAFIGSMDMAMIVAAAVVLVGAIIALLYLPSRALVDVAPANTPDPGRADGAVDAAVAVAAAG
jgi:hypothetical protein